MSVERLNHAVVGLEPAQMDLLCEMADAFRRPVNEWLNPKSELVKGGFSNSLLNRLRLHHATSEQKFNKTSFEYAFKAASRFAGRTASKTAAHTFQGADVVVDNERWSLKTEAAAGISRTSITISKFSEARWIRDCFTGADFARETTSRLMRHLNEYDRVITLRAFSVGVEAVQYDLVEIPHDMLTEVQFLKPAHFSARTKNGSSSARVSHLGNYAFTVGLDGSVEKVTLRSIQVSQCFLHARWIVPILPQDDEPRSLSEED